MSSMDIGFKYEKKLLSYNIISTIQITLMVVITISSYHLFNNYFYIVGMMAIILIFGAWLHLLGMNKAFDICQKIIEERFQRYKNGNEL